VEIGAHLDGGKTGGGGNPKEPRAPKKNDTPLRTAPLASAASGLRIVRRLSVFALLSLFPHPSPLVRDALSAGRILRSSSALAAVRS